MVVATCSDIIEHFGVVVVGTIGEARDCVGIIGTIDSTLVGRILNTAYDVAFGIGDGIEVDRLIVVNHSNLARTEELVGVASAAIFSPSLCAIKVEIYVFLKGNSLSIYAARDTGNILIID